MQNSGISLDAFEVVVTTLQRETMPSLHDQLMLCRIALSLIADVRESNGMNETSSTIEQHLAEYQRLMREAHARLKAACALLEDGKPSSARDRTEEASKMLAQATAEKEIVVAELDKAEYPLRDETRKS